MPASAYQMLQQNANRGRVRLVHSAISLHPDGPAAHDDVWLPTLNADGSVRLHNSSTGHFVDPTPADVVTVTADTQAPHDGLSHLRVTLRRRLWLRRAEVGWLPRGRRC